MSDTELQEIWHELNKANLALVNAASATGDDQRAFLATAQDHAKRADILLKQRLAKRG